MEVNKTMIQKRNDEKGVTTVEYAVMLVLVAIAVATAAPDIGAAVQGVFSDVIALL
jgi:Flp pilus assembly pilin Flp